MRIIFAGTPEFAAAALRTLFAVGHDIALVLTQPDRPAGRGMKPSMSAVKQFSLEHGLAVLQPDTLKSPDIQQQLAEFNADIMVVAAYGLILPTTVLDVPRFGCVNIHASLLPRWRGAAPIQRALLASDAETGISIMQMDAGLDTGAVLLKDRLPIAADDTAQTLHDKLAVMGADCVVRALDGLVRGELHPQPQNPLDATYAAKVSKAEAQLDWRQAAPQLACAVRAYIPFPIAQVTLNGEMLKIWRARAMAGQSGQPGEILAVNKIGIIVACGEGALQIEELQKAGGKRLPAEQFVRGFPVQTGERFEQSA